MLLQRLYQIWLDLLSRRRLAMEVSGQILYDRCDVHSKNPMKRCGFFFVIGVFSLVGFWIFPCFCFHDTCSWIEMRSFNLIQIFTTLQVDRYQLISFHRPNVEELEPFCVPRPCGTAAVFFFHGSIEGSGFAHSILWVLPKSVCTFTCYILILHIFILRYDILLWDYHRYSVIYYMTIWLYDHIYLIWYCVYILRYIIRLFKILSYIIQHRNISGCEKPLLLATTPRTWTNSTKWRVYGISEYWQEKRHWEIKWRDWIEQWKKPWLVREYRGLYYIYRDYN